jgi:UDP-2,4-diacetamido-2,4,6-trideoxy-beta-L-altropyranose hydrolase
MNVAIRADASLPMGTGHLMRCLTLADALRQRGGRIRFVSRHMTPDLAEMLTDHGHELKMLEGSSAAGQIDELVHAQWLGTSQAQDAQDTLRALSDRHWDWVIVDHYALDARWESMLRGAARSIGVIDDIADRRHDCDILLDQNILHDHAGPYAGKVPDHCELLLGPRFALLRDEFRTLREQARPRTGTVARILIFLGGVDADNYTGRVLDAYSSLGPTGAHVDVVIGAQHPERARIETECRERGFACHVQTTRMAELMAAADLAIGAGGSATWERCCLGVPTLAICIAENQRKLIADAAFEGLLYAPQLNDEWRTVVARHVKALIENPALRNCISRKGMDAVDGRGAQRAAASLGCTALEIREAHADDSLKVFEWRNHPTIRAVSRDTGLIEWESHQRWFAGVLSATDRCLLIGQLDGLPVGVVRFDAGADEAEISIYLAPDANAAGQGRSLLLSAERWLSANRPAVRRIRAHVLGRNDRSHRLFSAAGYEVETTGYLKRLH